MWDKERGWVLSIDQASISAGASLWYDGELKHWAVISGGTKSSKLPTRLRQQQMQLRMWLEDLEVEKVSNVLFEDVKGKFIMMICGAFLVNPRIDCHIGKSNLVHTSTWKGWARKQGATGDSGEIKGVEALRGIGWDFHKYPIDSDDVADSILIYLAWRAKA